MLPAQERRIDYDSDTAAHDDDAAAFDEFSGGWGVFGVLGQGYEWPGFFVISLLDRNLRRWFNSPSQTKHLLDREKWVRVLWNIAKYRL